MDNRERALYIFIGIVIALIAYMIYVNWVAPNVAGASGFENAEEWDITYNPDGSIAKIVAHRQVHSAE